MRTAARSRRTRAAALLPLVLLFGALSLTGCVRMHATMAVSTDDRVSGELIIATLPARDGDTGPRLKVPAELVSRVRVQPYVADGYLGTQMFFNGLTFGEMKQLSGTTSTSSSKYQITLRRSGSLVSMSGSVDLTQVPADRADLQFKISFPGTVTSSDGRNDNGTVSWKPKPGQVNQFTATAQFAGSDDKSWFGWAVLVGSVTGGVALLVVMLAFLAHRRSPRPDVDRLTR